MEREDIQKLAKLARVEISEAEVDRFGGDLEAILAYVDQISEVDVSVPEEKEEMYNQVREDSNAEEPGAHTETLVDAFPDREKNYLKVKQVLR